MQDSMSEYKSQFPEESGNRSQQFKGKNWLQSSKAALVGQE